MYRRVQQGDRRVEETKAMKNIKKSETQRDGTHLRGTSPHQRRPLEAKAGRCTLSSTEAWAALCISR